MADPAENDASAPHAVGGPRPAPVLEQQVVATFCFVDIAGYTALTDSHGEHAAADLVDASTA